MGPWTSVSGGKMSTESGCIGEWIDLEWSALFSDKDRGKSVESGVLLAAALDSPAGEWIKLLVPSEFLHSQCKQMSCSLGKTELEKILRSAAGKSKSLGAGRRQCPAVGESTGVSRCKPLARGHAVGLIQLHIETPLKK